MSSSIFTVHHCSPPLTTLQTYNFHLPAHSQPKPNNGRKISKTVLDAFYIREQVFVREQDLVPLEYHIDIDDARSWQFVIYASKISPSSIRTGEGNGDHNAEAQAQSQERNDITDDLVPIGTCRIIPPPYGPHPKPGSVQSLPPGGFVVLPIPNASDMFSDAGIKRRESSILDRLKSANEVVEEQKYLQIGRFAVLKEWRGKGVADRLNDAVVEFLAGRDFRELEVGRVWDGRLLAYARVEVMRMWLRSGFVVDEGMGTWVVELEEGGIPHCGMWRSVGVERGE